MKKIAETLFNIGLAICSIVLFVVAVIANLRPENEPFKEID